MCRSLVGTSTRCNAIWTRTASLQLYDSQSRVSVEFRSRMGQTWAGMWFTALTWSGEVDWR